VIGRRDLGKAAAVTGMTGLGGLPVRRLDQTRDYPPTGIQPGSTNTVRAKLVIVSGTGVSGVFVYNGMPGLGNPPIVAIGAGSVDPYGNTVVPGLDVTQGSITGTTITGNTISGGTISGTTISGTTITGGTITGSTFDGTRFIIDSAGMFFYTGTPASGNLFFSLASSAGTDGFGNAYPYGIGVNYQTAGSIQFFADGIAPPTTNPSINANGSSTAGQGTTLYLGTGTGDPADVGATLQVQSQFYAFNQGGEIGSAPLIYFPGNIQIGNESGAATTAAIYACVPGSLTAETWHTISLSATWTAYGFGTLPQYRLNATGMIDIKGDIVFTSTGVGLSGSNPFTAAGAIPSAYQPAEDQYFPAYLISGSGVPVVTANRTPYVRLDTGGTLTLTYVSSNAPAGDTVVFGFKGSYQTAN
jgi:hypothetical protein